MDIATHDLCFLRHHRRALLSSWWGNNTRSHEYQSLTPNGILIIDGSRMDGWIRVKKSRFPNTCHYWIIDIGQCAIKFNSKGIMTTTSPSDSPSDPPSFGATRCTVGLYKLKRVIGQPCIGKTSTWYSEMERQTAYAIMGMMTSQKETKEGITSLPPLCHYLELLLDHTDEEDTWATDGVTIWYLDASWYCILCSDS